MKWFSRIYCLTNHSFHCHLLFLRHKLCMILSVFPIYVLSHSHNYLSVYRKNTWFMFDYIVLTRSYTVHQFFDVFLILVCSLFLVQYLPHVFYFLRMLCWLPDYCRSLTIVTNNQNVIFTLKIDQFHPKTGQRRHFFEVKLLYISQIPLGSIRLTKIINETTKHLMKILQNTRKEITKVKSTSKTWGDNTKSLFEQHT